jgi:hypothetical protein
MTTTTDQLAALCARPAEFEIPAIASVPGGATLSAPQETVQLTCHKPSAIAPELRTCTETLTQVTDQAGRLPRTNAMRLSVGGLLPGGVSVLVYGGLWGTHRGLGADLAPDATTTIPLPMLRHAVTVEGIRD